MIRCDLMQYNRNEGAPQLDVLGCLVKVFSKNCLQTAAKEYGSFGNLYPKWQGGKEKATQH